MEKKSLKLYTLRKASRSTYQLGVEDIQDSFGFKICRQTLHTYVKQTCSSISCIGEPNPDHAILLADGTKVKNGKKTKHHDVRVIASYGEENDKVILSEEIKNKKERDVLVRKRFAEDNIYGIEEVCASKK